MPAGRSVTLIVGAGGGFVRSVLLCHVNDRDNSPCGVGSLDELATELLKVGAVLSQMVEFHAAGRSAPDAAPIPEIAHSLIRAYLADVRRRHATRDTHAD